MTTLPAGFAWREAWPVGTRLRYGDRGLGTVTEHLRAGPVVLLDDPYRIGRGEWRLAPARFEDVERVTDAP